MSELDGQTIGRYRIQRELGHGGMATVYLAQDPTLRREVAIKVIRRSAFGTEMWERMHKRFEREAHALALLDDDHIVKMYDYGDHEGIPFIVMQYVTGGTLKQRMGGKTEMPMSLPIEFSKAASLLLPIVRALAHAHEKGILHRDIKPANILVTKNGKLLLSDFGIAKILEDNEGAALTSTGMGIGTAEYMAPEQGRGKALPQSDIYSLGIILYELVTGRKPFTGDTPVDILLKHAMDSLPPPRQFVPDLAVEVEQMLQKALSKAPEERYASMVEFAGVLEELGREKGEEQNNAVGTEMQQVGVDKINFLPAQSPLTHSPQRIGVSDETFDPMIIESGKQVVVQKRGRIGLPPLFLHLSKWAWGMIGLIAVVVLGVAFDAGGAVSALIPTQVPTSAPTATLTPTPVRPTQTPRNTPSPVGTLPSTSMPVTPTLVSGPMPLQVYTDLSASTFQKISISNLEQLSKIGDLRSNIKQAWFSNDGRYFFAYSEYEYVKFDALTFRQIQYFKYTDPIMGVSPAGDLLILKKDNNSAQGIKPEDGTIRFDIHLFNNLSEIYFSSNGGMFLMAGYWPGYAGGIWNSADGSNIRQFYSSLSSPSISDDGTLIGIIPPPDTYNSIFRLSVENSTTGKIIHSEQFNQGGIMGSAFSPDNQILAVSIGDVVYVRVDLPEQISARHSAEPQIRLISLSNGNVEKVLKLSTAAGINPTFSPDGSILVNANTTSGKLEFWDVEEGTAVGGLTVDPGTLKGYVRNEMVVGYEIDMAFSPDGKYLASWSNEGSLQVWAVLEK